jgi:uncharacterized membrane protein
MTIARAHMNFAYNFFLCTLTYSYIVRYIVNHVQKYDQFTFIVRVKLTTILTGFFQLN